MLAGALRPFHRGSCKISCGHASTSCFLRFRPVKQGSIYRIYLPEITCSVVVTAEPYVFSRKGWLGTPPGLTTRFPRPAALRVVQCASRRSSRTALTLASSTQSGEQECGCCSRVYNFRSKTTRESSRCLATARVVVDSQISPIDRYPREIEPVSDFLLSFRIATIRNDCGPAALCAIRPRRTALGLLRIW